MKLKGVLGLSIVWLSLGANLQGQELELRYSEGMMLAWNDDGSGGDDDGAFWAPFIPRGFFAINHTARSNYNSPSLNLFVARALREDSRPLAAPIGYELIWTDSGSGADRDGAFWRPIPPAGYVSLGTVGTGGGQPGLSEILCVRRDLVEVGSYGRRVYTDAGSGADSDFSAWNVVAPANCIHLASYVGHAGYGVPDEVPYCLKRSAVLELPYNSRVGSVDERLARPQNPIAADAGQWDGQEGSATTRFEELVFTPGAGMLGNYYDDCSGVELYHVQHVVRLPNKDGRAYFAVTQSRAHNGWLSVMRTYPDRIDPATDRVIPSDSGAPIGEYVWQDLYGGPALGQFNPIGNWNHPCKMELIGNVLVVVQQNFEANPFCTSAAMGVSEDALLFYDVRDPENPVYWGMIPAYELGMGNDPNRDILDGVGILRDPQTGKYILRAQGTNGNVSWISDTISPDIGDWQKLESIVGYTGQHGMLFNSYQINTEPGRVPRERVMWYERDGNQLQFFNLVNGQASLEKTSNSVAFSHGSVPGFGIIPGSRGGLPGADRDWNASSLYVTRRGVPIIYSMISDFGEVGRLFQVTDSRNHDLKTPRPDQLVTTALDGVKGSLRWAIGKGGVIKFDPSLDGKILDLSQGPLVNYLHTVVVDASNLERGITIRGGAHRGPVFILGRETSATLRNITLTGGRAIVGGGILNEGGSLSLDNCIISDCHAQQGGGLANMRSANTSITGSTLHSNEASVQGGGIINNGGSVYMLNSTIWNNYGAQKAGAGLRNEDGGEVRLVHTTVSGNRIAANFIGAGIANFSPSNLIMVNSIVADNENLVGDVSADIQGDVEARGPNLVEGGHLGRVLEGPAFLKGDPMFGPFDGRVLRLQAGSPAIDAARLLVETDQLGADRSVGDGPDLGAVESTSPVGGGPGDGAVERTSFKSLGTGTGALLGGDLTDPEDDGVDAGSVDQFAVNGWNLVNVMPNEEPGFGGGEFAFNVFDNQLGGGNAKWCCNARDITFEFEDPVSVTHFTIASADDVPNRDWRVFRVQGSNDGATFETFYENSGEERLWKERLEVLRFDLTMMTDPYRFIRFEADSNWGDNLWQIGEIEIFGGIIPMPRVHYAFNEESGTAVENLGSGSNGTLVNASANARQTGSPDGTGYLQFNEDGAGSTAMYVTTDLSMEELTDYTMMAWIRFENNTGNNMIFGQLGTGAVLHNGARNTSYHQGHWANDLSAGAIEVGVWHHVAYRYDGVTQSIFVDGIELASADRGPVTNTSNIVIGTTRDVDWDLAGGLDDVRIYDVALSAKNIASLARPARMTPFTIIGIQTNQDGSITLSWTEIAGRKYEVSYSTDLKDGFRAIATDLSGGSFTDIARGSDEPVGFYRITELD